MILAALMSPLFRGIATDPTGSITFDSAVVACWPVALLPALERSRLVLSLPTRQMHVCPGCPRACVMEVSLGNDGGVIQCSQEDVDYGLIEIDSAALRTWHFSRSRLVTFVARELKAGATDADDRTVHVPLGTWRRGGVRRALSLEFGNSVVVRLGDANIELGELMKLRGEHIYIDEEELQILGNYSHDCQTGGKRYQHSRLKQLMRAQVTKLRNVRLQAMADDFKRQNPTTKKLDVARAIIAAGEFGNMDPATVSRIIRVPSKMRRKNFA